MFSKVSVLIETAKISIIAAIIVFGGILAYFGTLTDTEEEKKPIRIAINEWPGYAHAFIAQENGFFEKNNVEVELVYTKDYTSSQNHYIDGDVDGVFQALPDVIFRNSEGLPPKVVYIMDYSVEGDVIMGSVDSLSDLKGKTVGIEGVNSFSHIFVLSALESVGLNESNVFFENILAQNVPNKLEEGIISAGHTWEPSRSEAIEKGYKVLATAGDYPYLVTDVLVFNENIISERPEDISNIIKSLFEAQMYQMEFPEDGIKIMAHATGMSEEAMASGLKGVTMTELKENYNVMNPSIDPSLKNSIEEICEFYIERGQISYEVTFDEIIDNRFVNELNNK